MDEMGAVFYNEAIDLLAEIEDQLLALESEPDNSDLINGVFRAIHTIKGSSGMFGFDEISKFSHEVETALDKARNGEIKITKSLIDYILQSKDIIEEMLNENQVDEKLKKDILNNIKTLSGSNIEKTEKQKTKSETKQQKIKNFQSTFRIKFSPHKEIFLSGNNPIHFINDLYNLGDVDIFANCESIPSLEEISSDNCYVSWNIVLTTDKTENDIKDIFIFIEDICDLDINIINEFSDNNEIPEVKRIGEILIERGDINKNQLENALNKQTNIGNILISEGLTSEEKIEAALLEQQHLKKIQQKKVKENFINTIKVDSSKLDLLVDLVGEMVTAQARLYQTTKKSNDSHLKSITEEIERLTCNLRDNAMSLRMVQIGTIFNKYNRLVRDLSKKLDKKVKLETSGGNTELDKSVIDKLGDPLVHIIRNSMDHGIEDNEERKKVGKEYEATISLSAKQVGSDIIIQINDDGKGIHPEIIYNKALEKGIISEHDNLNDGQILNLIFEPGFSTAKKVSSVSGRGVGMDVVRKNIESLRGSVGITSQFGYGTSVTMRIPLTLAIIEGLLTSVNSKRFVLPLASIVECIELKSNDIEKMHGKKMIKVRGELIPYISLREEFNIYTKSPQIQQIVILEMGKQRIGLLVDRVLGNYQTVIKPLGDIFSNVDFISGATILGDGSIGLIIDVSRLYNSLDKGV